ncbi:MAG: hypothetical protein M1444_02755 [Patescibacteria group bacterium]|nr:hypothetical protein [Patescibacteria group bacterium]
MKTKIILVLFLLNLIFTINAKVASAQQKASVSSAQIVIAEKVTESDYRVKILEDFFEKQNSPLAPYAGDFVRNADKYNLDWKLVAAISGVESTFGLAIPFNSYNAWGWGVYGDNVIRFASWTEGIDTISQGIRERYMNQWGGQNIYQIGAMYASSPAWASHVERTMNQIQDFAIRNPKDTLLLSL